MSTATLPPPEPVVTTTPAQPVTKQPEKVESKSTPPVKKEEAPPAAPPKKEDRVAPATKKVTTKPHGWEPKSDYERIAFQLGEIVVEAAPDGTKPAVEGKKPDAVPKVEDAGITGDTTDADLDAHVSKHSTGLSKEQAHRFKELTYATRDQKRKLKEAEAKVAEYDALKAKVEELEKGPKLDPETESKLKQFDELKARYDEAEAFVAAAKIESSATFRKHIGEPMKAIEEVVSDIAKAYDPEGKDGIAAKLVDALRATGREQVDALDELTSDMKGLDKTEILRAASDYRSLIREKESMLSDAKAALEQISKEEQAALDQRKSQSEAAAQARKAEWDKAVPEVWDEVAKRSGIEPIDGNAEFNGRLDTAKKFASEVDFGSLDTRSQVEAMHRAAIYPFLLGKNKVLEGRVEALNAEIAKLTGASLGAGDGNRQDASAINDDADKKLSFEAAVAKRLAEAKRG